MGARGFLGENRVHILSGEGEHGKVEERQESSRDCGLENFSEWLFSKIDNLQGNDTHINIDSLHQSLHLSIIRKRTIISPNYE